MRRAFIIVTFCALLAVQWAQAKLILRLRLQNGSIQRVEVDDENESIADFRNRLVQSGKITGSSEITFKSGGADASDHVSLSSLCLANGEIVNVTGGTPPSKDKAPSKPANSNSNSNSKSRPVPGRRTSSTASSAKSMSNADIDKRRQELTKIARQKTKGNRYVACTKSAGRVLDRLASGGGCAVLMGRVMLEQEESDVAAKRARERALQKLGRTKASAGLGNSESEQEEGNECIEVHAVCELSGAAASPSGFDYATHPELARVRSVARGLGLSIVGCCIGSSGGESEVVQGAGGGEKEMWSPAHVTTALQLQSHISDGSDDSEGLVKGGINNNNNNNGPHNSQNRFVVLSVSSTEEEELQENKSKRKSPKVAAAVRQANPGLAIEAFELSDQCYSLFKKGVIPRTILSEEDGKYSDGDVDTTVRTTKTKTTTMRLRRLNSKNVNVFQSEEAGDGSSTSPSHIQSSASSAFLQLSSAVLTQSDETTRVDPLLLAVPLPIVAVGALSPEVMKKKAKSINRGTKVNSVNSEKSLARQWQPSDLGISFEHSFPSTDEQSSNPKVRAQAEAHLLHVLEQISPLTSEVSGQKKMFLRMRDVHLLLHLSHWLDENGTRQLCAALGDSSLKALPQRVAVGLEVVRLSLEAITSTSISTNTSTSSSKSGNASAPTRRKKKMSREQRARGDDDDIEEI